MSRDARQVAEEYYARCQRSMSADLDALCANPRGVILLMPELTALLKPARSDCPDSWYNLAHSPADSDAWYIHLLVGHLGLGRRLLRSLEPLRYLCFQRGLRHPRPHRLLLRRLIH